MDHNHRAIPHQDPHAILDQAEQALQSASGSFNFFAGRGDKYRMAADLFARAGNVFKMHNLEREAGQAFERAAEVLKNKLQMLDAAANVLVSAFRAYRNVDPETAAKCLNDVINHYRGKGNFYRAATYMEMEGELFDQTPGDTRRAIECYEKSAGWYEVDNSTAFANKLWLKVAELAALVNDYYKAAGLYERIARRSIGEGVMGLSVKEYLLRAGLCYLATGEAVNVQRALAITDPDFENHREHTLLEDLAQALEDRDEDAFVERLSAYDQLAPFGQWETHILVKIKTLMKAARDDDEIS